MSAAQKYLISKNGFEKLFEKRRRLISETERKRKEMGKAANADKDLRENPHFMELRTEIIYGLSKELSEIDLTLQNCEIIENTKEFQKQSSKTIRPGSKVTVVRRLNKQGEIVKTFLILGWNEANIQEDIISYLSPFGQTLLGKKVGDSFFFQNKNFEIIKIEKGLPQSDNEK